jgi:hypothetical protein
MGGNRLRDIRRQLLLHHTQRLRRCFTLRQVSFSSSVRRRSNDPLRSRLYDLEITAPPNILEIRVPHLDGKQTDSASDDQFRGTSLFWCRLRGHVKSFPDKSFLQSTSNRFRMVAGHLYRKHQIRGKKLLQFTG